LRTLYIFNKFYQGNAALGPTSSWETIWHSFLSRVTENNAISFNPDSFGLDSNEQSDSQLIELIKAEKIELIVMIYHIGIGWKRSFISEETLKEIKARGIRIVAIWGDIQIPDQRKQIWKLAKLIDLNVMTASHAASSRFGSKVRKYYSWVPLGNESKVSSRCDCGASVSFAGSLKNSRQKTITKLQRNGVRVHIGGGEGNSTLNRDDYLKLLCHPMSISFAGSKLEPLVNARTFEVISQQTLLLEQWGRETPKFLIPYVDYVPWFSARDLVKKVNYYSRNPQIAQQIAFNGKAKFEKLTDAALWEKFSDLTPNSISSESFTRGSYLQDLEIGRIRSLVFRLADAFATNPLSNFFFESAFRVKEYAEKARTIRRIILRKALKISKRWKF
jgi:hypothetical protein